MFIIGRPQRFIHIFNYVNEIKAAQLKGSRAPLLVESLINLLKALCARENDVKGDRQRLPVTKIITEIIREPYHINAIIRVQVHVGLNSRETILFNNTNIEIKLMIKISSAIYCIFCIFHNEPVYIHNNNV